MEPARYKYKGHRVELRAQETGREDEPELLVDDTPVRYGRLPGGLYYLSDYAYDWTDDLVDLTRRFVDYRLRAEEIQHGRGPGVGE